MRRQDAALAAQQLLAEAGKQHTAGRPEQVLATLEHAETLRALGRHAAEAVADFDRALAADPDDSWSVERRQAALDALRAAGE